MYYFIKLYHIDVTVLINLYNKKMPANNSYKIYNASAGSGKTFNLVKEYLILLLTAQNNDAYRNILAITFTNKAVNEMKSRIVNRMIEFSNKEKINKESAIIKEIIIAKNLKTVIFT